jgi:hypothetical protein
LGRVAKGQEPPAISPPERSKLMSIVVAIFY